MMSITAARFASAPLGKIASRDVRARAQARPTAALPLRSGMCSFTGPLAAPASASTLFGSRLLAPTLRTSAPQATGGALNATMALPAFLPLVVTGVVAFLLGSWLSAALNKKEMDASSTRKLMRENASLRVTIEELSAIAAVEPEKLGKSLPHPPVPTMVLSKDQDMSLEFKPGINRKVLLGRIDQMLENKDVNIAWLPDNIERQIYANVMSLMLSVMDDVLRNMSMNFAGHRVNFGLTYLNVDEGKKGEGSGEVGPAPDAPKMNLGVFTPKAEKEKGDTESAAA